MPLRYQEERFTVADHVVKQFTLFNANSFL
jgi:hypothetical protein